MTSDDKSKFYVAEQYIQASKNLIVGMLEVENPSVVFSDHEISGDELNEGLKNSSLSIILPTLFCLYQGIELILKGFVNYKSNENDRHNANALCEHFSKLYTEEHELSELFNKFVSSPKVFIKEYMEVNNIKEISEEFYNSLRYPDKKEVVDGLVSFKYRNYYPLKYPDNKLFLAQVEELNNEIGQLLILSVRLFRKLEDK